jgi:hypothetical protein
MRLVVASKTPKILERNTKKSCNMTKLMCYTTGSNQKPQGLVEVIRKKETEACLSK